MNNFKALTLALLIFVGTASAQTRKIDPTKSKITWLAKKVGGQHSGTVNLKDGTLIFKGQTITGGNFTVDMTTITATDLTGEYQAKLNGHLHSEDFFNTTKYPLSKLVFKKVTTKTAGNYTVTADLTIKGITEPITFDVVSTANTATAALLVNRTKYNIKYGSKSFFESIGDKAIDDDFELKIVIQF